MKKALALITAACMATPAFAWGDREQGALAGIFGTLIYQHLQRDGFGRHPAPVVVQPPVVVQQPQVIYAPAPAVVYRQPQYPRLVIDMNGPYQCTQGLAPHYLEELDFRGNVTRRFYACQ